MALGGHVAADAEKAQAESIAKSIAAGQVVANQIAVMPPGRESVAKAINSDLDKGIENNLEAALIQKKLQKAVKYDVKNGVVTSLEKSIRDLRVRRPNGWLRQFPT